MYAKMFGLTTSPFPPLSDPEEIFRSSQLRETVQHFAYARRSHHAIFLLTGEVGTGKTTAMRAVELELPPGTALARVSPTTSTADELLDELCEGFGLVRRARESKAQRLRRMETELARLNSQGGTPVVVLDEAHLLPDSVLETVRLLTNLRHGSHPAIQVCLVGQPELVERLRSSHLRQLRQRVTLRYTMLPLTAEETELYLIERLRAAGSDAPQRVFEVDAARAVHAATAGLPREINVVADQALTAAFLDNSRVVRRHHVESVERDFAFEGVLVNPAKPAAAATPRVASRPPSPRDTLPIRTVPDTATFRARDVHRLPPPPVKKPSPQLAATSALQSALEQGMRFAQSRPAMMRLAAAFGLCSVALALTAGWIVSERAPEPLIGAATEAPDSNVAPALYREEAPERTEASVREVEAEPEPDRELDPELELDGEPEIDPSPPSVERTTTMAAAVPAPRPRRAPPAPETTLASRYPSTLEVVSGVPAVVYLGSERLGMAPGRFTPVPPGRHELRLEAADGRVFSKSVIVTPGSTTYVRAQALAND